MDINQIKQLAGDNQDLFKSLLFGYLRSSSETELGNLFITHLFESHLGAWIFRCFIEHPDGSYTNQVADILLAKISLSPEYKISRKIGSYLSRLFDKCSDEVKLKIIDALFLGGKTLRKYGYSKRLDL